jgi:hypothetical protein
MLHSKGHGYENPSVGSGYTPCEAFKGLTTIANPLGMFDQAARDSRSFVGKSGPGVTYSSHALQIGVRVPQEWEKADKAPSHLFLMMSHGGGRVVYSMRNGVYYHPIAEALTALDERTQYSLAYSIWDAMDDTRRQAIDETNAKWRQALAEGRVVKRRAKGGRAAHYEIESEYETAERERKAHNKRALAAGRERADA